MKHTMGDTTGFEATDKELGLCEMGADRSVLCCPLCGAFASEPCKWPSDED